MFGKVFKSVTGVAKSALKSTKNFRSVLSANPGLFSLTLPPQISMGIQIANQLGIKIPSEDELVGGLSKKFAPNLYRQKLEPIINKVDSIESTLNSIDWLL